MENALKLREQNLDKIRRNMAILDRKKDLLAEQVKEASETPRIESRSLSLRRIDPSEISRRPLGWPSPTPLLSSVQRGVPVSGAPLSPVVAVSSGLAVPSPLAVTQPFNRSLSPSRLMSGTLSEVPVATAPLVCPPMPMSTGLMQSVTPLTS